MKRESIIQGQCIVPVNVARIRGLLADNPSWIGWDRQTRGWNLSFPTNNTQFLILPWVRVQNFASHLLAQICRELSEHWIEKYGHPVHLLETFVEQNRFRGICCRAAGWTHVGATAGRSRNERDQTITAPVKDVFLYPLHSGFRGRLLVPACARTEGRAGR